MENRDMEMGGRVLRQPVVAESAVELVLGWLIA